MLKHVPMISASLRGGSNSELPAKEARKGANEADNRGKQVSLKGKKLQFCIIILAHLKTGKRIQKDDAREFTENPRREGFEGKAARPDLEDILVAERGQVR